MIDIFNKPYPYYFSCKRNFSVIFLIGIYVWILTVFSFDESFIKDYVIIDKFYLAFGFGLASVLGIGLVLLLVKKNYFSRERKDDWQVKNEILVILLIHIVIIFFNYLFLIIFAKYVYTIFSLPFILRFIFLILGYGLIPSAIIIWIDYTVNLKLNLRQVRSNNKKLKAMLIEFDTSKAEKVELSHSPAVKYDLEFDINDLLFMKSDGNYIEVYKKKNGKVVKSLSRGSIRKYVDDLSEFSFIIRTHRSYLVNLKNIKNTKGNARNYQLFFEGVDLSVPVSRSRFEDFNNAFKNC